MKNLYIKSTIAISITVSIVVIIIAAIKSGISFDTYWHIATGRDFLQHGDSLLVDHFSFTYFGNEVHNNAVAFQIIIAYFVQLFGLVNGIYLFKLSVYAFFLFGTLIFYKTNKVHPLAVLLTLPFITYFLLARGISVRPEIIGYVFFIFCLIMYFKTIANFNSKNLMLICLLLIGWANYHAPIFGYIIAFGLFLEKGISKLEGNESFDWSFYLLWCIIIFVSGYLNRDLSHAALSQINFSTEWKLFISEFQPIYKFYSLTFITLFFGFSSILIVWLLKTRKYGMLFISILLISQTWYTVRLISFSGVLITCLYAILLNNYLRSSDFVHCTLSKSKRNCKITLAATFFIVIIAHIPPIYAIYILYKSDSRTDILFPKDILKYLMKNYAAGNIFNQYHYGGFLAYYLPKEFKIYIDGRSNILYPLDFVKTHLRALHYPSILTDEIIKYKIDFVILENHKFNYELVYNTGILTLDFVDKYHFLAKRGMGNFPISGKILMKPSCWDSEVTESLLSEIRNGKDILPVSSPLREIHTYLEEYSTSNDKQQFYKKFLDNPPESIFTKRTLAYHALNDAYYNESILIFDNIKNKISTDIMAIAAALIKQHQYRDAFQILKMNFLQLEAKENLTSSEKQALFRIIKYLSTKTEIELPKKLLPEFMNVTPIESDSLHDVLCNTQILPVIEDQLLLTKP